MTYPDPNQPPQPMPPNGAYRQPPPMPPMPPGVPPGVPHPPMHPEAVDFYRRQNARARRQRWLWFRIVCIVILFLLLSGGFFWNAIFG